MEYKLGHSYYTEFLVSVNMSLESHFLKNEHFNNLFVSFFHSIYRLEYFIGDC